MTKFVDSFATDQLLPPWVSTGSTCWCFAIPLPAGSVKKYLDKYLNVAQRLGPAPYRFSALDIRVQYGLLVVCLQPNIRSEAPGEPNRLTWQKVVHLAIPVRRCEVESGKAAADTATIVWVQPIALGDNPFVMFGAREVWGLDMTHATIAIDRQTPSSALHMDLSIVGMKTFSPQSPAANIPCLHIATGVPTEPAPTPNQSNVAELAQPQAPAHAPSNVEEFCNAFGVKGYPVPPSLLTAQIESLPAPSANTSAEPTPGAAPQPPPQTYTIELNNLKQFRDVYDMNAAIYRAIVASKSTHTDVSQFVSYDPKQVELDFFWSDSVKEMLTTLFGINELTSLSPPPAAHPDWTSCRLPVELAYSFQSDIRFEVLSTIDTYYSPDAAPKPGLAVAQQS